MPKLATAMAYVAGAERLRADAMLSTWAIQPLTSCCRSNLVKLRARRCWTISLLILLVMATECQGSWLGAADVLLINAAAASVAAATDAAGWGTAEELLILTLLLQATLVGCC